MGVDFDQSACMTYKVNNPEVEVLCEDLTKSDVKNYLSSNLRIVIKQRQHAINACNLVIFTMSL